MLWEDLSAGACQAIKVDKVLSGSAERIGEKIIITLRILDTKMGELEKIDVMEYLNLPEIQNMVMISVRNLVGQENDQDMLNLLVHYNVPVSSPRTKINLSGPEWDVLTLPIRHQKDDST